MSRLRQATVLAVATCALLATANPAHAAPPAAQPDSSCADVAFLGARGSGEAPGLGGTVRETVDHYRKALGPGTTVETRPVRYPAVSVLDTDMAEYDDSVAQGVGDIRAQLSALAVTCPNTRSVLVGYSQGAHAVTRFLESIDNAKQLDRAVAERVAGIALFGSPVFAYDPPERVNRSLHGPVPYNFLRQGVYLALNKATFAERSVLSQQPWVAKTHSYCIRLDVVCQASSPLYRLLHQLFGIRVPPSSIEPHFQYEDHYAAEAGTWLAELSGQALRGGEPQVSPFRLRNTTAEAVAGRLGEQLTITLTAEGGSVPYRWDVAAADLPPGLSRTGGNTLSGIPLRAGSYRIPAEIRDADGESSTVTITIDISAAT